MGYGELLCDWHGGLGCHIFARGMSPVATRVNMGYGLARGVLSLLETPWLTANRRYRTA